MKSILLNGSDWRTTCYWRQLWKVCTPGEEHLLFQPNLSPIPATVPGAVHEDLKKAGIIPDWNIGLNSIASEWVNHRDWSFKKTVQIPADMAGRLTLEFDGLDYAGHVAVNSCIIGQFEGTHLRHEYDVTDCVKPGMTVNLEVMVYASPEVDAQCGYTSETRIFKPRFGYSWDWCARLVNIGIWQDVRLVARGASRLRNPLVQAKLSEDNQSGSVRIRTDIEGQAAALRYVITDQKGKSVASGQLPVSSPTIDARIDVASVKPWWPATHGDQPLYTCAIELHDADGTVSDRVERTIGFKRVQWLKNPGGPEDARPYVCEINGRPVYLRGINWVPPSPFYGTTHERRYESLIRLYRNMNANLLRVWGGGILERPEFYAACDRLGLLVWQEFPLSSSGVENWPPEYPEVIETLKRIAAEYIYRRSHHASHLLWCGGNELQGEIDGRKTGGGKPVDENHPCMRGFAEVVGRLDPDKRLLPTSPTGPRFYAQKEDFGKGLHHHIHGPWANLPLSERYEYFNGDDAMFRSELGAPGCESLEAIERFRGTQKAWPPRSDNAYWLHPACAWIPWRDVTREFGPVEDRESELAFVVKASQYLQAESYRYAAESVRRRAMYSSGFMIWMGHDCDHCTANNSVIELTGWTKPAYAWLQRAFAPLHVSLRHDRYHYTPGEVLSGQVWANRRAGDAAAAGVVRVRLLSLDGKEHVATELPIRFNGEESVLCGSIEWTVPECPRKLFVVDIVLELDGVTARNRYVLSQAAAHPMSPLRTLPGATLSVVETTPVDKRRRRTTVRNDGLVAAVGVELSARSLSWTLMADQNYLVILPGEQATFEYEILPTYSMGGRSSRGAKLQLDWLNSDTSLPIKE